MQSSACMKKANEQIKKSSRGGGRAKGIITKSAQILGEPFLKFHTSPPQWF